MTDTKDKMVTAAVTMHITFPAEKMDCRHCELWRSEWGARFRCVATQEIITDLDTRGHWCPLKVEEGKNDGCI